jgi:hypothetical protein
MGQERVNPAHTEGLLMITFRGDPAGQEVIDFGDASIPPSRYLEAYGFPIVIGRDLLNGVYSIRAQLRHEDGAGSFKAAPRQVVPTVPIHVIRDEVPQGISHCCLSITFEPLEHVRVVSENHGCAGVHEGAGLLDLPG